MIDDEDVVAQPMSDGNDVDVGEVEDVAAPEYFSGGDDWRATDTNSSSDDGWNAEDYVRAGNNRVVGPYEVDDLAEFETATHDLNMTADEGPRVVGDGVGVEDISDFLVGLQCRRGVPEKVMRDLVDYLQKNASAVSAALTDKTLPNYRTMRRQAAIHKAPTVKVDVQFEEEGMTKKFMCLKKFPKKILSTPGIDHKYTLYHVAIQDVVALHGLLHPSGKSVKELDLSVDGVPESKSSGRSIDILSIRFVGCRAIYCMAVLQPTRRGLGVPDGVILEHFLRELSESTLSVRRVIADAPKRASLQGLKQHSASYACPYCTAKKEEGVYPSWSFGAPLRTSEGLRAMGRRLEDDDFSSDEDREEICKGVKKLSPLSALDLDLIRDVPAEPMHLIHLGIVRKMLNLSYSSGSVSAKQVDFRRASDATLNGILLRTKSLRRFARFTRRLDTATYKAEEYRNCILAFWPAFLNTVPAKVTTSWLLTVFVVRAVNLPDSALASLGEKVDLERTFQYWYEIFEASFGKRNCSYNVHIFASHLLAIRQVAGLSDLSAVDYEDHYNLLKRSYRPGTVALGTQALQNTHLAKLYGGHNCKRSKNLSLMSTARVEDRLVFTKNKRIVKLTAIENESLTGLEVPVVAGLFLGAGLDLNEVWCFRESDVPEDQWLLVTLSDADVLGKCVLCDGIYSVLTFEMMDC